jgi:hypothetical protein
MTGSSVSWRVDGSCGHLTCGPLEAVASCDAGGHDLVVTKWNGQPASDIALLGSAGPTEIVGSLEIAERYVRGADLIAVCNPTGKYQIATQVYWRADLYEQQTIPSVELMLSTRTDLLDSVPTWTVTSFLGGAKRFYARGLNRPQFDDISGEARKFDPVVSREHLFVFRLEALGLSYAQMVHPSDFVSARATYRGDQPFGLEATLFPEHLEKGVIRRGRIRGWFLPVGDDLETAVKLARHFVDEPLPLTA